MARPSKDAGVELERLERASGMLATAQEAAGIVAIRFRQIQRRAPGLVELVTAGQRQLTGIADALDEAHALLREVLEAKGAERHAAHYGEDA